jgi:hypothetical protein
MPHIALVELQVSEGDLERVKAILTEINQTE